MVTLNTINNNNDRNDNDNDNDSNGNLKHILSGKSVLSWTCLGAGVWIWRHLSGSCKAQRVERS